MSKLSLTDPTACVTACLRAQWVSWRGRQLQDDEPLEAIGLRTDDEVTVEFVSPVAPPILTLLRKPEVPKPAKGGKKGKKGKKKK